jgi:hypothetical protein
LLLRASEQEFGAMLATLAKSHAKCKMVPLKYVSGLFILAIRAGFREKEES